MASEMSNSRRIGPHTPEESEGFSIYQNYTASEVFVQGLAGIVNQPDVEIMIRAQKQMLQRFEKTNEMLLNCNALSANRLKIAGEDFRKHIKLLSDMKKDLDIVFKKIRTIKTKLNVQYPNSFTETHSFAEEAEDSGDAIQAEEATTSKEGKPETPILQSKQKNSQIDKNKKPTEVSTVGYVKMEQSPENSKLIEKTVNEATIVIRKNSSSTEENSNNSNDSSDCTISD